MTWKAITESDQRSLAAGEVAEVKLANGSVQLAEWNGEAFTVPGMGVPLKNVAQWRAMADSNSHLKSSTLKPLTRE